MKAASFDAIAAQLERGELDAAARALLTLWRSEQRPELADTLDRFPVRGSGEWPQKATRRMARWLEIWRDDDPLTVPDLLHQLSEMLASEEPKFPTACFDALAASAPDPRVGRACARWVDEVDLSKKPSRRLYRSIEKAFQRHASPRDLTQLRRMATEGTRWANHISAMSNLAGIYRRLQLQQDEKADALGPLPTEASGRLRALAERASQLPLPAVAAPGLADVESMVDRVRAEPNEEAHRAVLRDRLLESSDPWGELMALQEQRAKSGDAKITRRESSLLKELRPRLLGSLAHQPASAITDFEFARGFLVGATVRLSGVTRVKALMSAPELATLERVRFIRDAALPAHLSVLREAEGVGLDVLRTARSKAPRMPLEIVTVCGATPSHLREVEWWPDLRELYLFDTGCRLPELLALPVTQQLRAVGLLRQWAGSAADRFDTADLRRAPASLLRVVLELYGGRQSLLLNFERAGGSWRARVSPGDGPKLGGSLGDYAHQLPRMKQMLSDAIEVEVLDGVAEPIHAALSRQRGAG